MPHDPVTERSKIEMFYIAKWYSQKYNRELGSIRFLLVGGWAVWCYNRYQPSVDIDIIASNKVRSSLFHRLRNERGFLEKRTHDRGTRILYLPHGDETITMDWGRPRDKPRFKGREEVLTWKLGMDNHNLMDIEGGYLPVPERGLLLLYKLKAIHDRTWDIEHNIGDKVWLVSKIQKDRSDILALLDPAKGGDGIVIDLIGSEMERVPFLFPILEDVGNDVDASRMYHCSRSEAKKWVGRFLGLIR